MERSCYREPVIIVEIIRESSWVNSVLSLIANQGKKIADDLFSLWLHGLPVITDRSVTARISGLVQELGGLRITKSLAAPPFLSLSLPLSLSLKHYRVKTYSERKRERERE